MVITGFEVLLLGLPVDEPLAGGPSRPNASRPTVLLLLRTDEGVEGIGFTFLGAGLSRALKVAVEDMAEMCLGHDPLDPAPLFEKISALAGGSGPAGIFTLAQAALDIALWDIKGKVAGQPLWRLLGAKGTPVPAYASGAMMRDFDLDIVLRACRRLTDDGHRQVKMQLALPGAYDRDREVDRIRRVREALGEDVELMCDVNQRWTVQQAIEMGRAMAEFNLCWLEDPIAHGDLRGQVAVNGGQPVPVATGEFIYRLNGFDQLLNVAPPDYVMIDPFRAGGITPWLAIAELAQVHGKPVVSHLAPEVQLHLVAAIPNGRTVEYMPWSIAMFREVPWPRDGYLHLGEAPGLGLDIDVTAVNRYRL
ncbi:mandelate racemase/muconate lactonizing enzyme family protein [Mesorhizobium sp. B2-6-1]|uniref:mandelate racemase/muconate lactonizing enzyme family protein n=1 Tax=Mesorhizobium sp. B2-6-1 TaxID=2589916 RepID=UPI00112DFF03|nr:mandelate racemase/muconate lactonizing enzyme family protein [Mesorhizobium sp. B2-6-1]TPJ57489.1 mandelate racemase/muconate lactonizing enzyme family protein [Mesorhizobium sp. B2-6-1]